MNSLRKNVIVKGFLNPMERIKDSVSEPNRVISFSIDYIDEDEEDHVTFHVSPEYYNRNKDTFLDIFEVMKKSFNHEDNFEK